MLLERLNAHPTLHNRIETFEQRIIKVGRKTGHAGVVFSNSPTLFDAGNYSWFRATEVSC